MYLLLFGQGSMLENSIHKLFSDQLFFQSVQSALFLAKCLVSLYTQFFTQCIETKKTQLQFTVQTHVWEDLICV